MVKWPNETFNTCIPLSHPKYNGELSPLTSLIMTYTNIRLELKVKVIICTGITMGDCI